jgi:Zn-dependent M16 (insulinase) family peptidase
MKRLALSLLLITSAGAQAQRPMTYSTLTEGQTLSGFKTTAVYLNDSDRPMGARFIHQRSGFTLDVLEIQSVPQAFVWVTTFPSSDMGEPHTQEHLLLGKGNKGRDVANRETTSLTSSTAFTAQWKTCYTFYTSAGADVFFDEFERRMDALLHPDYSDEEIRREVRNFGVAENPGDHSLRLEEKGTVYNEMVTSMDQPSRLVYYAALTKIYGKQHPLSWVSGGTPEGIRLLQPSDIRKFHAEHYHLANMGAIVSVPKEISLTTVLTSLDAGLNRIQPQRPSQPVIAEKSLPSPKPGKAGEIEYVAYPNRNLQQPGQVRITWPADRNFDVRERSLFELFLENFAGDPTTNLYKRLIDSKTRETDFGAQSVAAGFQEEEGHATTVYFGDVPVSKMNDRDLSDVRNRVIDELRRVASWKDGSPELVEFNNRLRSRVIESRRALSKFVNSPPGFGFRGGGDEWEFQLGLLEKLGGFRRSVTMKPALDFVEKTLAGDRNVWTQYINRWKLTDDLPWILAARPNADIPGVEQEERNARVAAEVARLKQKYRLTEDQDVLRRYAADYDAETTKIDEAAARVKPAKFIDNPPLTLDDQLDYAVRPLGDGINIVTSTFDSMTSATTGLALRLDGVPQDQLMFISLLPTMLTRVGVIENGRPIPYEEMSERVRKEILSLNADFGTNPKTGRVELVIRGSGNNAAEAQRALDWMRLVLFSPDWRSENLARIRDVVDQNLSGLRRTMQSAEENWVNPVATAYWQQDKPLYLATTSFLTQIHNVHRVRWMLKDATPEQRAATGKILSSLADLKGPRTDLKARLAELQSGSDKLTADAAKDLDLTLADIPDSSLSLDWPHLCREMANDLTAGPEKALSSFDAIRKQILRTGNARMFLIGSAGTQQSLASAIQGVVQQLEKAPAIKTTYDTRPLILNRLRERDSDAASPLFIGLLNPNSQGGVFLHSAPGTSFEDTGREKLLDFLAAYLYGGGGAHSIFMKTIGAGMAYSNGIGMRLGQGRSYYYAERTPELPLTMKFVIDEIKKADYDPALVEYAIAQAFGGTRSASSYEARGEAIAANLADGVTPEIVARFHREILNLRNAPDLASELFKKMPGIYAQVLPGLGTPKASVKDGIYFVIGPEKQFAAWEEYLKSVEGAGTKVYRLYPRDFWMDVIR